MLYHQLLEAVDHGYVAGAAVLPDGRVVTAVMQPSKETTKVILRHLRSLSSREKFALGVATEVRARALSALQ
jgi:hypothetical protein